MATRIVKQAIERGRDGVGMSDLLENLSAQDQRKLYEALAWKFKPQKRKLSEYSTEEVQLWDALSRVCNCSEQLSHFVERYGRGTYIANVESIFDFVDTSCGSKLPQRERDKVLFLAMRCLASHIGAWMPVTPKTMLGKLEHLNSAVDERFPGYIATRLLGRLAVFSN